MYCIKSHIHFQVSPSTSEIFTKGLKIGRFYPGLPYCILHVDFFVISQLEQIRKWGIKYAHLVTTDHMSSTCAHHYPHTKFHQYSPYRTLDICLFVFFISQSEQICKWGIKYAHLVTKNHMGSTCAHHYPHTKFHQCSPYRSLDIWLFCY